MEGLKSQPNTRGGGMSHLRLQSSEITGTLMGGMVREKQLVKFTGGIQKEGRLNTATRFPRHRPSSIDQKNKGRY